MVWEQGQALDSLVLRPFPPSETTWERGYSLDDNLQIRRCAREIVETGDREKDCNHGAHEAGEADVSGIPAGLSGGIPHSLWVAGRIR